MHQTDLIAPEPADTLKELCTRVPLERCPCCGGKALHHSNQGTQQRDTHWFWVQCEACGLATQYEPGTPERCIPMVTAAWNQRTPASTQAGKATA